MRRLDELLINGRFLTQPLSGVQRYGLELSSELAGRDLEVVIATPRGAPVPPKLRPFVRELGTRGGHSWEQCDLARLAARGSAVLWSPGNTGPVATQRQLVTLHDMFVFRFPSHHTRSFRVWYKTLHRLLVQRGVSFAAVSQYTRDEISNTLGVDPDKIAIVPDGVSERFRLLDRAQARVTAQRMGLFGRYALCLAVASERKNLGRLIDAWRVVRTTSPDVQLVLAGGASFKRLYGYSLPELNVLEPLGVRVVEHVPEADLPAIYSAAELVVMPSLAEGFGLPALEALACGTPVVVSANSALVENFASLGGVLVDPYSAASIASGLLRVLRERAAYAPHDPSGIAEAYSWPRAADRLLEALARVDSDFC
ncbi:MAG TPA: glycosyltransferase family 1 protein [Gaiellales bacterium]|nr:glycosyltransferase family 1 protein [Gaiellales bacterium]